MILFFLLRIGKAKGGGQLFLSNLFFFIHQLNTLPLHYVFSVVVVFMNKNLLIKTCRFSGRIPLGMKLTRLVHTRNNFPAFDRTFLMLEVLYSGHNLRSGMS